MDFPIFLGQIFVIPFIVKWILKKYKSPVLAVGAVALISACAVGYQLAHKEPNLFQILGVNVDVETKDLARAYKQASLSEHPDKGGSPEAFIRIKTAYETLKNPNLRVLYDRFGENALNYDVEDSIWISVGISMVFQYLVNCVVIFLFTSSKEAASSRNWLYVSLIVLLLVESLMRLGQVNLGFQLLPWLTKHDRIGVLHSLFPGIMHAFIMYSRIVFVDRDEQRDDMMKEVLNNQKFMIQKMIALEEMVYQQCSANKSVDPQFMAQVENMRTKMMTQEQQPAFILKHRSKMEKRRVNAQQQQQGKKGIPQWAIMLGLYILFNYVLK
eukprot:TRINITY_DN778120_c0_g1_i1.p1 TRINITY_DN778120_c0_g1~~TRINITY_DN778120_c0_g1_i1.p1  ORF type:complete len:327 (+),score=90.89 TRINITY_DN778120_c0_g1_i1:121-1101(+)